MRYFVITFIERNGEHEYYDKMTLEAENESMAEGAAEVYAQQWYDIDEEDDEEYPEKEYGEYYHCGGQIAVSVRQVEEISEEHYNILRNYF
jgi:hypothetical protein